MNMTEKSILQQVYDEFIKGLSETKMFKEESLVALKKNLDSGEIKEKQIEAFLNKEGEPDENSRT
jgi:hypothetical protein